MILTPSRYSQLLERELQVFRPREVIVGDGTPLRLLECGAEEAPPLLIVNPIGVPSLLVSRLARMLARCFRVTCWEQRGFGAGARGFFERPHDFDAFVADLVAVAELCDANRSCPMIGVCSGASVLVRAAGTGRIRPSSLTLISPLVRFETGYQPSQFEATVIPYMRMISGGRDDVAVQLLELSQRESFAEGASDDAQLVQLADRSNVQSLESLKIYARSATAFMGERCDAEIAAIGLPVAIAFARGDKMISAQSARKLATLFPCARLREYSEGGHHAIFLNERIREDICADLLRGGTL